MIRKQTSEPQSKKPKATPGKLEQDQLQQASGGDTYIQYLHGSNNSVGPG